jgi:hypothetical protein
MTQTTDSSSLDSIAARIDAKFSAPVEESRAPVTQPEPTPAPTEESQQAPAAPSESEESEQEAAPETPVETAEQPATYTVKVDGKDVTVTLDDLVKGFSFTEHNTRKAQAIAEEKRALDAERQRFQESEVAAVRAERAQYAEYLAQLSTTLKDLTPKEPNWEALKLQVSADVYADEVLRWTTTQKQIAQVEQERAAVKAQQDAEAQSGFRQYLQQQQEQLEAAIPEFKDPEKSKALKTDLTTFGVSQYGFTEADFASVTDARLVRLLHDARLYHTSKAKAPAIENKIEKVLATSLPGNRTTAPVKNELAAAHARLKKSGSTDDAAEAIRLKFSRQRG